MRSPHSIRSAVTLESMLLGTVSSLVLLTVTQTAGVTQRSKATSTEPTRYAVIDLGYFSPVGINDSGVVVSGNGSGPAIWAQGTNTPLSTTTAYGSQLSFSAVGIDDAGHIGGTVSIVGNNWPNGTNLANIFPPYGAACYWASTNSNPVILGTELYGGNGSPEWMAITSVSPQGFMVGTESVPDLAVAFAPSGSYNLPVDGYGTSYGDYFPYVFPVTGAAGTNQWCGSYANYMAQGPIINGTPYTDYPTFNPLALNSSNIVVGYLYTNGTSYAATAVPGSGTTLAITNLGAGTATHINDLTSTSVIGTTTNVVYSPQIIGYDGSNRPTLWDQTKYDGTPTNTFVPKSINAMIAQPNTNSCWDVTSVTGINNGGAIIGTANSTKPPFSPVQHGVMLLPMDLVQETTNGSGVYTHIDTAPIFPADDGTGKGPSANQNNPKGVFISFTSELTTTTTGIMNVSIGGPGGYFSGILTETSANSGIFQDSANTVVVSVPIGTSTSNTQVDVLAATISSTSLGLSNATFSLVESDIDSLSFYCPIQSAEIIFTSNYNSSVTNTINLNLQLQYHNFFKESTSTNPISINLSETVAGSMVFTDSVSGLTVTLTNFTGTNSGSVDSAVASFSGGIIGSQTLITTLTETNASSMDFTSLSTTGDSVTEVGTDVTPDNPDVTGDGVFYLRVKGISEPMTVNVQSNEGSSQQITLSPLPSDPSTMISGKLLVVPENASGTTTYSDIHTFVTAKAAGNPAQIGVSKVDGGTLILYKLTGGFFFGQSINNGTWAEIKNDGYYNAVSQAIQTIYPIANTNLNLKNRFFNDYTANRTYILGSLPFFKCFYLMCHGLTLPPGYPSYPTHLPPTIPFQGLAPIGGGISPQDVQDNIGNGQYSLVYLDACSSADDKSPLLVDFPDGSSVSYSSQTLNMATKFNCKAYIGWSTVVYFAKMPYESKAFFQALQGDTKVSEAINAANNDPTADSPPLSGDGASLRGIQFPQSRDWTATDLIKQ